MAWGFIVLGAIITPFQPVLGAITMFPGIVIRLAKRAQRRSSTRSR